MNTTPDYKFLQKADALFAEGQALFGASTFNEYYDIFERAAKIYLQFQDWEKYLQCRYKMAYWKMKKNRLDESKKSVEEILNLYQSKIGKDTQLKGDLYDLLSVIYFDQWKYQESLEASDLCLTIYTHLNHYKGICSAHIGIGNVYNHTFRHREALQEYYKALKIIKTHGFNESGYIYYNMAVAYRQLEHLYLSQTYYQKALFIFNKNFEQYFVITANIQISLGEIAALDKQYELAKSLYQDALDILQKKELINSLTAIIFIHMGKIFAAQNNWKQAEDYFEKAIDFQQKHSPDDYEWFSLSYNILAHLYISHEKWSIAEAYLQKSLSANEELTFNQDMFKAKNYSDCAYVLQKQNKLEQALSFIEKAVHHQKIASSQQGASSEQVFLNLETQRIRIYFRLFQNTQSIDYLQIGLQTIPNIIRLIEDIRANVFQEADQINFNEDITDFYQLATDLLYEQYLLQQTEKTLKEIFLFSEKNKVHSLLSTIKNVEALQLANIPKEELRKLQQIQSEMSHCQTQLQEDGLNETKVDLDKYAEELVHLQIKYHQLTQEIEQNHPEYLTLKHQMPLVDLEDVQSQLPTSTALIEYTLTNEFVYIFCITSQQIYLERIALPTDIHSQIDTFIDEGILGMNRKVYVQKAHQLHQILIAPIKKKLDKNNIDSLLIIPDNRLLELPFEVLLTQKTPFKTAYSKMTYLVNDCNIHYHYSATLRHYQQHRNPHLKELPNRFLGFAPVYDEQQFPAQASGELPVEATRDVSIQGRNYKALLYSEKEVKDIQESFHKKGWEAEGFLRSNANLEQFKEKVHRIPTKFIHIAAHGVSNQKKNILGILFSPNIGNNKVLGNESLENSFPFNVRQQNMAKDKNNILYAHEVYQLKLQSDLVFLSCCESGVGKIAIGEGILSLNRGLLYAGVSNIVFTLFKIYDQTTAIFAHHFYDYLLNKEDNYSKALQYAKLQLIAEDLPPRYWGGFLLLGD
ncbi:MAG: CHAT domain-containing tetratricopeptide repeat protein [Chitinophagales bacterium]